MLLVLQPMFWLGVILPICFVAPYTGATIPTQWPLLCFFLVPSLWSREGYMTPWHWLGLAFFAYACFSQIWSPDPGYGLWIAAIWVLSFWWGSTKVSLFSLWQGLAWGLILNLPIAIAQKLGHSPVMYFSRDPAGLLYNSTLYGSITALVMIQLIRNRQWWLSLALCPGLVLAHSFGGYAILGLTLVAAYIHWSVAVIGLISGAFYMLSDPGSSDQLRLAIWGVAWAGLKWQGWGAGSFTEVFLYQGGSTLIHPEFSHNDFIQLWFEYGAAAVAIYAIIAAALLHRSSEAIAGWYAMFPLTILALFYFPLWNPILAFLLCATAGHILRRHDPLRGLRDRWRSNRMARTSRSQPIPC